LRAISTRRLVSGDGAHLLRRWNKISIYAVTLIAKEHHKKYKHRFSARTTTNYVLKMVQGLHERVIIELLHILKVCYILFEVGVRP
jgi:hypothetical protein